MQLFRKGSVALPFFNGYNNVELKRMAKGIGMEKEYQTVQDTKRNKMKKNDPFNWKREAISWAKIIISAVVIAFVINNFIIINANVPSGSMQNTIMTGDRMIGNRLAYVFDDVERGDIVIFKFPDNKEETFVKRVIGLSGDRVTITKGKIYINDNKKPLEEDYLPEEWIQMNDGLVYNVPEDSYFVLGDNRNISNDARYWDNTYVKRDDIIAEAVYVYWPISHHSSLHSADYSIDE